MCQNSRQRQIAGSLPDGPRGTVYTDRRVMHVTLLLTDLFWPLDDPEAYRGLALPALERLLARARRHDFAPISVEAWLCQAFEVERQLDWPVAPITLGYDGGDPGDDYWLRADPVHLAARRDHLTLLDPADLDVRRDEADELVELLNRHFSADGMRFQAPCPRRWYVRLHVPPRLVTRVLSETVGRDTADALPAGEEAARWRRALTEAQMLLHEHPVNERREARGEPPINSIWLWGGGRRTPVPGLHFTHVAGDSALAHALAAQGGAETITAARLPGNGSARVLFACETSSSRYGEGDRWRAALAERERTWFEPMLERLRRGSLEALAIVALHPRGCTRFEVRPSDLIKFWKTARPIAAHLPRGAA